MITPEEREILRKIVEHISKQPIEKLPAYFTHEYKIVRQAARLRYDIETCEDERLRNALKTVMRLQVNVPL